jgi:WD40 repeat protein
VKIWEATNNHDDAVSQLMYSSDGRRIAAASLDGSAAIWDVARGAIRAASGEVQSVACSPDGRILATATGEAAQLWYADTGALQQVLDAETPVSSVAFTPDGRLATIDQDRRAQVWDITAGISKTTMQPTQVLTEAISPDGLQLATADHNQVVYLRDTGGDPDPTNYPLQGITAQVTGIAYRPDGQQVATSSLDGTVRLWDPHTSYEQRDFSANGNPINAVAYSPDGTQLATAAGCI